MRLGRAHRQVRWYPTSSSRLDQLVRREPVGELLVQLRSRRLRQRLVRRIADEQMAEAEALVHRKRRRCRAGSAPCGQASRDALPRRPSRVRETAPRPRRDGTPHPRPTPRSMHDANVAVERVDPCLEERLDRRWNHDLAVAAVLAHHREHLLDVERVPGRRRPSMRSAQHRRRAQRRANEAIHEIGALFRRQRLEQDATSRSALPPPHPGRTSSSSLRATQSRKIGASRERSAMCSTRSTKTGSAHCRSSITTT